MLAVGASALGKPARSLNEPGCVAITYCGKGAKDAADDLREKLIETDLFRNGGLGVVSKDAEFILANPKMVYATGGAGAR